MNDKKSIRYLFFITCIYLLIFQNILTSFIKPMQYFDEILSLLVIPILLIHLIKNRGNARIKIYDIYLFVLVVCLLFVGFYSSLKFRYQPIYMVLSDALLVIKFFLTYMLSQLLFDSKFIINYKEHINKHTKFLILLFFLLTIVNYLFKIWPSSSYRFGIMTNQLFFSHATVLAALCIFLLALYLLSSSKINKLFIILIYVILISTLRFKAIGASLLILFILLYLKISQKKLSLSKLGIFALITIVLAWDQISYYYIDLDGNARKVLNETSIRIAKDYFPVGTGFATFGSHFSSVSYSPIYYQYGISNTFGLQKGATFFISDTFWPMIIGQFGFLGTIIYLLILFIIFIKIQHEYNVINKHLYISKLICFGYMMISSTSESAFVSSLAIPLAIIIGLNCYKKSEKV